MSTNKSTILNKDEDMNPSDMITLIAIAKSRIDKGATFEEIEKFIVGIHGKNIMSQIEPEINEYLELKNKNREKNQPYWMLICNPKLWGDGSSEFEVNELLKDLDTHEELWKINANTSMHLQMKIGQKGIIKVSEDSRSKEMRKDEKGNLVPLLESGIYGLFEIVEHENGSPIDKYYDEYMVNIQMFDNFYKEGINIPKEKSRELLGDNVYNSIPSRKIDKKLYDDVVKYIENIRK